MTYLLEHWKPVVGFEGIYAVSNVGRVRIERKGCHLTVGSAVKARLAGPGYWYVNLYKNGIVYSRALHCLVAEAFVEKPDGDLEVNHKDAKKDNPRASNLEYVSHGENIRHAIGLGRHGAGRNKRILETEELNRLIEMKSEMSYREMSRITNIPESTIRGILKPALGNNSGQM